MGAEPHRSRQIQIIITQPTLKLHELLWWCDRGRSPLPTHFSYARSVLRSFARLPIVFGVGPRTHGHKPKANEVMVVPLVPAPSPPARSTFIQHTLLTRYVSLRRNTQSTLRNHERKKANSGIFTPRNNRPDGWYRSTTVFCSVFFGPSLNQSRCIAAKPACTAKQ